MRDVWVVLVERYGKYTIEKQKNKMGAKITRYEISKEFAEKLLSMDHESAIKKMIEECEIRE